MRAKFIINIRKNRLGQVSEAVKQEASVEVTRSAQRIAINAKANLTRDETNDTGSLRDSIYVSSMLVSSYNDAVQKAQQDSANWYAKGRTPKGRTPTRLDVLPERRPRTPTSAFVGPAAGHGLFVEFGTVKMSAKPFMSPAVMQERVLYRDGIIRAVKTGIAKVSS